METIEITQSKPFLTKRTLNRTVNLNPFMDSVTEEHILPSGDIELLTTIGANQNKFIVHKHPTQTDSFRVLKGRLRILSHRTWFTLKAGESYTILPDVRHTIKNCYDEPVTFINSRSDNSRFFDMLQLIEKQVFARKIVSPKSIKTMQFEADMISVSPPQWVVRVAAFIARGLGFRLA
jgi:mannose-6-phosphate isomerase-like protein (cupin superfamily)